ncbi:unnamed protein product [Diabrotica balteata]|uniref:Carboxylic ester hydrolase n=1 Tax=Diabrotica balteata TaxID=107213 RepID=A0A9N9STK5_DIABA|nr:unnamed protein product [Diabrotica balteata]
MKVFKVSQIFILISLIALHESTAKYIEDDGTIVQLEEGKIRGHILKSEKGNDYYAFQEIPYAAPPVGENRFQLAKPPKPWTGVLNTTRNTKICHQNLSPYTNLEPTEDCLYINVYTPQKPGSNNLLPVLLYIHGGAFVFEAGTFEYFGPKFVIDSGIVVVTFNCRLGVFGFVGTNDGVIPLNIGLKDQISAMEWVQKNIHLFGGDPNHVTIAGESSGSLAVDYHLLGPWENGKQLFHAAIMQSLSVLNGLLVQDNETNTALSLGRALDPEFKSNDTKELLKVLQNAEASDIFKLQGFLTIGVSQETEGPFSYNGFEAFLSGNYKNVPVLSGFTSEEAAGIATLGTTDILKFFDDNPSQLIDPKINMSAEDRHIAGTLRKQLYTHNTSFVEDLGGFIRYCSDRFFINAIIKQVELTSPYVPHYLYRFAYIGEISGPSSMRPSLPPAIQLLKSTHCWTTSSGYHLNQSH